MAPTEREYPYRVRLDPDGNPIRLKHLRERREKGWGAQAYRGAEVMERTTAELIIAERQAEFKERTTEAAPLTRGLETFMSAYEQIGVGRGDDILQYLGQVQPTVASDELDAYFEMVKETIIDSDPINTMTERPLTFLSQPLPIMTIGQWQEIRLLTEAAQPVYSLEGHMQGVFGTLADASLKRDAQVLAESILAWTQSGQFQPGTIQKTLSALARIHNADCLYFGAMYFPGETDPHSFVPNLAFLYEQTAENLRYYLNSSDGNGPAGLIAATLQEETLMLRVIQAQEYEFITHKRPVDFHSVLLPVTMAIAQEATSDRRNGVTPDYRKYAAKIIGAFQSRRCSLSDDNLLAIFFFLRGQNLPEEVRQDLTYQQTIPWLVLENSIQQAPELDRYHKFRQAPTTRARTPTICRALARINLDINFTRQLVPPLLLEARKIGYLPNIDSNFYQRLKLPRQLWDIHQAELQETKPPLRIHQGDIVVFLPLSGWCLTESHLRLGAASQQISPEIVKRLEIAAGKLIRNRRVNVIFTFGEHAPKIARGMPKAKARIHLADGAVAGYPNVYVAQAGEIDATQERSVRIKQLMGLYSKRFGVTWSLPNHDDYPSGGCIPLIAGATEKLGTTPEGVRATAYQPQADKPAEDVGFLNGVGQIFALLQSDIESPSKMEAFINGLIRDFGPKGTAAVITHFPELHSSLAADFVKRWLIADAGGNEERAMRLREAFETMVPAAITDQAWEMMLHRAQIESMK